MSGLIDELAEEVPVGAIQTPLIAAGWLEGAEDDGMAAVLGDPNIQDPSGGDVCEVIVIKQRAVVNALRRIRVPAGF